MRVSRNTIIYFTLILFPISVCAVPSDDWSQWTHFAEISLEPGNEQYCKLTLTPQMYDISQHGLNDIRMITSDDSGVPYILYRVRDKSSIK